MKRFAAAFGAVGALMYFFDPQNGKRRRKMVRDRTLSFFRRSAQPDDITLAHKVETEIFRDPSVPKAQINVNAEHGKVVLRGEVDRPELIDELVQKTRKVQGVQEVENLLHVSGQS